MLFRETPAIHPADLARNVCMPLNGEHRVPAVACLFVLFCVYTNGILSIHIDACLTVSTWQKPLAYQHRGAHIHAAAAVGCLPLKHTCLAAK
jgi:hypothetical protein